MKISTIKALETVVPVESVGIFADDSLFSQLCKSMRSISESLENFGNFCEKVSEVFKQLTHWISHPMLFIQVYEQYVILAIVALIVLRKLGFNTDKYLRFTLIIFIISLIW